MRRTHRLTTALIALGASGVLAACGSTSSSTSTSTTASPVTTNVTVAYVPIPLFDPLYIAMAKGYFAKEHINVHLTVVSSGQSATALAATNRVQVVLGGFSAGMFDAIKQGLNFKVVGSMAAEAAGTAANGLVVANGVIPKGKTLTASDLRGAKIAIDGGSGAAGGYLLAEALKPYHLTLADVNVVNLGFPEMQSALANHSVAAAYPSAPFLSTILAAKDGTLVSPAPVNAAVVGVIYGGSFAKTPAAQHFFDALAKGAQDLQGSAQTSSANLAIIAKATGESISILKSEPPSIYAPNLAPPTSTLSAMQQVYLANGLVDYHHPLSSSAYIDASFANKVQAG
ncbi:ABC transporter substrate-binding protein [Ferrimicrobium acidiphilum]|uniref:ABC transporter substrate-binding protein n=1 Tax=Ferrimicrobium acidiphilum TaxID=121039 RepID=UPI0023F35348|nr:ABC transporter substrate-binding protein [Ferrimicrobium acidiphilum]